jgi:para-aminobenzoate synthetase component I
LADWSGAEVFQRLFLPPAGISGPAGIATLLESPVSLFPQSRYSICAGPPRRRGKGYKFWTPALGKILPCLGELLHQGQRSRLSAPKISSPGAIAPPDHLPFSGGWLGWLGYDLSWEIEQLPWRRDDPLPFPVGYWYEPEAFAVLDHAQQQLWLAASHPAQLDQLQRAIESPQDNSRAMIGGNKPQSGRLQPRLCTDQQAYQDSVLAAKKYIQAGDIFQANLSLRFQTEARVNAWELYQTLQQINPSPFACFWQTPWGMVVSCSPERLVSLKGQRVETRPIAGTRPRGKTPAQDRDLAQELLANAKEKAEHTMLVDLERNDLGRVCNWGSVRVNELLQIESYSHVFHLVSNVVGELRPDQDAIAVIRALFPGGTITGCPKVRCMEIIEELEPVRRSLFYGSCGYLDQRGNLDLNILIRTLLLTPRVTPELAPELAPGRDSRSQPCLIWGQVGAGIVADSQPEQEWYESLQKAQAQFDALQRIIC